MPDLCLLHSPNFLSRLTHNTILSAFFPYNIASIHNQHSTKNSPEFILRIYDCRIELTNDRGVATSVVSVWFALSIVDRRRRRSDVRVNECPSPSSVFLSIRSLVAVDRDARTQGFSPRSADALPVPMLRRPVDDPMVSLVGLFLSHASSCESRVSRITCCPRVVFLS
jgi:hypothetical protein